MSTKQRTRVRRNFRHPLTGETTAIRYSPERGMISRPMRAGQDVCAHVFVSGQSVERCREAWGAVQRDLLREGFEIVSTERY